MEPDTSQQNNNNSNNKELSSQRLLGTNDLTVILRKTVFLLTEKRKVNEKLILITKNRFYIRSHRTPTKLDFSVNLLRIRSIHCKDGKHVTIGVEKMFGTPVGSKTEVVLTNFDFIVEPGDQEELLVALLTPLKPLGMWHDRIQLTIEQKDSCAKVSYKIIIYKKGS